MSIMPVMSEPMVPELINEDEEAHQLTPLEPTAIEAQTRAEVDVAIATARRFPRSIQKSLNRIKDMALSSPEVAESCFYALPPRGAGQDTVDKKYVAAQSLQSGFSERKNKPIIGPSTRLAEIVRAAWGNIRVVSRVTQVGERHLTVQSVCQDMETNNTYGSEIRRQIWGSRGRYSENMIATVAAAAIKIAERNATFAVVPRAIWDHIYTGCRKLATGEGKSIEQSRKNAMDWAKSIGVTEQEVFFLLDVKGLADIGLDQLEELFGIRTSLSEGLTTVDEVFRPHKHEEAATTKTQALAQKIKDKADATKAAKTDTAPVEQAAEPDTPPVHAADAEPKGATKTSTKGNKAKSEPKPSGQQSLLPREPGDDDLSDLEGLEESK
jgi:hypothetical protein